MTVNHDVVGSSPTRGAIEKRLFRRIVYTHCINKIRKTVYTQCNNEIQRNIWLNSNWYEISRLCSIWNNPADYEIFCDAKYEIKFAFHIAQQYFIHEVYFIAKLFHLPQANFIEKRLFRRIVFFQGVTQTWTGDKGVADPCLTTWLWRRAYILIIIL